MTDTLKYIYQLILNLFFLTLNLDQLYKKATDLQEKYQLLEQEYLLRLALYVINRILIEESILRIPHEAGLLYNKGSAELQLKKYKDAIQTFEQATISIKPLDDKELYISILNNLGSAYHSIEKLPAAKNTFKEIIEIEPNFHMSYYNLGLIFNEQKKADLDNAIKYYDKAIEKKKDYFDAIYNKACALYQKADQNNDQLLYQEAIRELD